MIRDLFADGRYSQTILIGEKYENTPSTSVTPVRICKEKITFILSETSRKVI